MPVEPITTAPFRIAFPQLFEAKAATSSSPPKFSINMLWSKNNAPLLAGLPVDTGLIVIRKMMFAALQEKFGVDRAKWPANLRALDPKGFVSPLGKDGWAVRDGDMVSWDGFAGCWFARAASSRPPIVVDHALKPVSAAAGVRGGLICRARINAFAYDREGSRGVSLGLDSVQILKDDGVVYGGGSAEGGFDPFAGGSSGASAAGGFDDFGGIPPVPDDFA